MTRGLVIGKFYPPHKGHLYLIDEARKQSDEVTVIVCHKKEQTIPGELRARWIQQARPDVKIILVDDLGRDDDSKAWAEYTMKILGDKPDFVFTSEDYGEAYAKFLGSKHILVDKQRVHFPISATAIRNNPYTNWQYLEPDVRGYYAKRVCILGAESTGTTTLTKALAEHYKTAWVPEFGRYYWEGKMTSEDLTWQTAEFIFIAQQQNELEDELAKYCNKILICDTNSFATSLWHERYLGHISKEVEELSLNRRYDLYILTDVDIPFVQDGTRDGEHIRSNMHDRFVNELKLKNKNFIVVSGSREKRLDEAIACIDKLLRCPT